MRTSPQSTEHARCAVCRAEVAPGLKFCDTCGSPLIETPAQEIRSVNYLLSELARWESDGKVDSEQAAGLRESYERRREELRSQLNVNGREVRPAPQTPRRALLEIFADTQTIRLLLYAGAGMLVVGVIIWLRDVLYMKLQEPIVQAALLAAGTICVTAYGWFTILRTRLKLTGRALTMTGSLLIPVNFWFLARSGLIESSGRAWIVCALCTLLYALTAAFLRERLYVYLASAAAIASLWTLIYRYEREAFGLYALALITLSLIFLHLSHLLRLKRASEDVPQSVIRNPQSQLMALSSHELWGPPLVHVALAGAALAALLYMPLRLGSSPSFTDGILRLRADEYDASVAMLLFALAAYAAWFAGRYVYRNQRALLYTASALALLWTEFLALDGLGVSAPAQLLALTASAFIVTLAARTTPDDALSTSLRRASLIVSFALAALIYPVLSADAPQPVTHSMILALLAATYAVSGAAGASSAQASVVFVSAMILVMQAAIQMRVGDPSLVMPSLTLAAFGLFSLGAGLRSAARSHVQYFRAGLYSITLAFVLACLHAGYEPLSEIEFYTTPVAVLLLVVAYVLARRGLDEYAADARLLLWAGSLLLSGPLIMRALEYRLLLGVPAPLRDMATLLASLVLILLGVSGRLRAPLLAGASALALELAALALTSVEWLQIPLKVYLISVGALILLVWGLLEFRREQLLLLRQRLNERRVEARERFGEWR